MAVVLPELTPTAVGTYTRGGDRAAAFAGGQERLRYLLDGNRNATLNDTERTELESYPQLEHFVRRLKIHARGKLAAGV